MLAEDPFEFHGSDSQEDAPVIVRKTPPTIKKTPPSAKRTPNIGKKKTPRLVISKNSDEINEMLDIKRAIEESKKTALQEERARRYNNRMRSKDTSSSTSVEKDDRTPSRHHQETSKPVEEVVEVSGEITEMKDHPEKQKETSPCASENTNDASSPSGGQHSSAVQQVATPVGVGPSSSRESTPILNKTPTKVDSPISTPNKKDSSISNSGFLSTRNRFTLKRKRIPSISKEPSIKLFRVDTDFVKKTQPDQQKSAKENSATDNTDTIKDDTVEDSHKSTGNNSSAPNTFQNGKDCDKEKTLPKPSEAKLAKRRKTVKTTKEKSKMSSPDIPQCHVNKCPSMYAPRGTNACDYLPVILRVFEEFKRQLKMAQSECVTFIPWSAPLTSSKKDWQSNIDDGKSSANKPSSPLALSSPYSPVVKQQQKETKGTKETVEADSLWNWNCAFDSDDQRLFYDSDYNVDPKSSQETTPPQVTTTSPLCELVEQSPSLNKDISINISSSNSNASLVIRHGRRKRKLLGRKIVGSSEASFTGTKQSSTSRPSWTSSLPRGPIHHSLSSPNISDDDEPEEPTAQLPSKKSVIDLTELEEMAEGDSHESPSTSQSQEKQATCPVCQQLFSEAYIAVHAADCELHVDSETNDGGGRILPRASTSSTKFRQTTLTHKISSTSTQQKKIIESDSDPEEVIPPPPKKRKTRKLLSDKSESRKISSVRSEESDAEDNDIQLQRSYLVGRSLSTAVNTIFKSASVAEQAVDDIDSYSSEDDSPNPDNTAPTIIDYKNQFSTTSVGRVSKELLVEDNEAFILSRQKKWSSARKGKQTGKGRQKRWKSKNKGRRYTKR